MITVQLERGGVISEMDEALLEKRVDVVDNENEFSISVEYCLAGCSGLTHETDAPTVTVRRAGYDDISDVKSVRDFAPSFFCAHHIHRSAHVTLKPVSASGEIEPFK